MIKQWMRTHADSKDGLELNFLVLTDETIFSFLIIRNFNTINQKLGYC